MVVITGLTVFGQVELLTVAESSDFKSTSTYAEIISLLKKHGVHVSRLGNDFILKVQLCQ